MKSKKRVSIPVLVKGVQGIAAAVTKNAETIQRMVILIGALDKRVQVLEGTDDGDIHTDEQDSGVPDTGAQCADEPGGSED